MSLRPCAGRRARCSAVSSARAHPRRIKDLAAELDPLRQVKDEDELARLRRAIGITSESLVEAMRAARPGMFEYELQG